MTDNRHGGDGATLALADWIASLRYADLPARTREVVRLDRVDDPALDMHYPVHFAGWVAAQDGGEWMRVDVLDPSGSVAQPIDAAGITEKFRGINPRLPTDRIAAAALNIEAHPVRELLDLLGQPAYAAAIRRGIDRYRKVMAAAAIEPGEFGVTGPRRGPRQQLVGDAK